jgi:hypothetical protein
VPLSPVSALIICAPSYDDRRYTFYPNGDASSAVPFRGAGGTLIANGTTKEITLAQPSVHVSGNFGGGSIVFQFRDETGAWRNASPALTSADDFLLDVERAMRIRGVLTGATNPALAWSIK